MLSKDEIETRLDTAAKKAVLKWGESSQLDMVQEEAAELLLELVRRPRGRHDFLKILEESVDVYIMLAEVRLMFGEEDWLSMVDKKLSRLEGRLNG